MIKKKICLIGAFAAGKTSLVQRHVHSIFSARYYTTVGVRIEKKQLQIDEQDISLILWDLHGEDDFQSVQMSYLKGASGLLFVVDGTRRGTVEIAAKLRDRARSAVGPVPTVIAVNKVDLDRLWEIRARDLDTLAEDDTPLFFTSAKTGESVDPAFRELAKLTLNRP